MVASMMSSLTISAFCRESSSMYTKLCAIQTQRPCSKWLPFTGVNFYIFGVYQITAFNFSIARFKVIIILRQCLWFLRRLKIDPHQF